MQYLFLLLILESFKKLWVETSEHVTRRGVVVLHLLLFGIYLLFTVYDYVPADNPYEGPTPDDYDGGIVIRPKDAQQQIDAVNARKSFYFSIGSWFLSVTGIVFIIALVVSIVHSWWLFKQFKPEIKAYYLNVGKQLVKLLIISPLPATTTFIIVALADGHRHTYLPYRGYEYFDIFLFLIYVLLFTAIFRLSESNIYRPNWMKTIGWLLLWGAITFVLVVIFWVYAMATTNFSH